MKKIAILTSGGDSPGMNAAVRSVIKYSKSLNFEPFVVYEGYKGLVENRIEKANYSVVDQYLRMGGTFIYSARLPEFKEKSVQLKAVNNLKKIGIDALVVIGGDGSYMGALRLHEHGIKCVGLPGTIDNDISSSEKTIGFDTALNTIVDVIDKIQDTSISHARCCFIEIMGRNCADLTICAGLATASSIIITPQNILTEDQIIEKVKKLRESGKREILILVTELIYGKENRPSLEQIANSIKDKIKIDSRVNIIGHTQRGGKPSAYERYMSTLMGAYAVDLISKNVSGVVVGNKGDEIIHYEIEESLKIPKPDRSKWIEIIEKLNQI